MTEQLHPRALQWIHDAETRGFHRLCGFRILSYGNGHACVAVEVTADVENPSGFLHGGAIATLIDQAGTIAILTVDRDGRPGVSTDLNVSFLAPVSTGTTVVAEAAVLKVGKSMAFVEVAVRRHEDNVLVAHGRMTKFQG